MPETGVVKWFTTTRQGLSNAAGRRRSFCHTLLQSRGTTLNEGEAREVRRQAGAKGLQAEERSPLESASIRGSGLVLGGGELLPSLTCSFRPTAEAKERAGAPLIHRRKRRHTFECKQQSGNAACGE